MRALASELCKKVGMKKLRKHGEMNRCMIIRCKGMREKAGLIIKGKKPELRNKWKDHLDHRERVKIKGSRRQVSRGKKQSG